MFARTRAPARRIVLFVVLLFTGAPRRWWWRWRWWCRRVQPAPVPTAEKALEFFRHPEILHVPREAVPEYHMTLQCVFEGAIVAEVHPRHEVGEG